MPVIKIVGNSNVLAGRAGVLIRQYTMQCTACTAVIKYVTTESTCPSVMSMYDWKTSSDHTAMVLLSNRNMPADSIITTPAVIPLLFMINPLLIPLYSRIYTAPAIIIFTMYLLMAYMPSGTAASSVTASAVSSSCSVISSSGSCTLSPALSVPPDLSSDTAASGFSSSASSFSMSAPS